jgi:arylsulfatase
MRKGTTVTCIRPFSRRTFLAGSLAAGGWAVTRAACAADADRSQSTAARPNVVLIMADDLGRYALGAYGGVEFRTPRLDQLARQGMKLTNCGL